MISKGSPDTEDWSNHCCTVFYSNKKDIYFSKSVTYEKWWLLS